MRNLFVFIACLALIAAVSGGADGQARSSSRHSAEVTAVECDIPKNTCSAVGASGPVPARWSVNTTFTGASTGNRVISSAGRVQWRTSETVTIWPGSEPGAREHLVCLGPRSWGTLARFVRDIERNRLAGVPAQSSYHPAELQVTAKAGGSVVHEFRDWTWRDAGSPSLPVLRVGRGGLRRPTSRTSSRSSRTGSTALPLRHA